MPFFIGQLVEGATAGMIAFLLYQSDLVERVGVDAGNVLLAFALGFSEAVFIGLVRRISESAVGSGAAA